MTNLPTGTVTFLFTDIQGSTRLLQELGDAWPPLLERHRQIARAAWVAQMGVEVGTEGDSFFVVFTSALPALAAAAATQHGLAAEAWPPGAEIRVRIGMHTGEGVVRGGGYVGLDVHRAARIANAGHGGQVLVSATTHALVEGSLPDGLALRELGEHRLKDLSRPEHIWDLVIEGLPGDFPPLRTLDAVPNNLPTQLTTFLGRQRELAEAAALLDGARLLTLTGPGGTGKTRLALQLAADATERFHDGVYFVPLGTIGEPALVVPTIAQALGMPDPGGGALDRLAEQLEGKQLLLVLDNFEQVIDAAPQIGELLTRLPDMRVLATSRSPMRVYGEQEYPVPPLALPDPRHLPDLETLGQFASVALFVERAMAVRPGFAVDPSNAPAIAEICVRLDGLPLAIELAAARVRVLSPPAILSRLGDRLSLLAGGSTNMPERQQTLRGAIAWSHELLEPGDRGAFARLSVFAGGSDLAAVEGVALRDWPPDAGPPPDPLEAVSSLLDKSLLRQEVSPTDEPRFQMLESIRVYGLERLDELETGSETRRRHADYYLALAESLAGQVFGAGQRAALDALQQEHDNLRAAITFAIDEGDAGRAMRLLAATWRFWQMRGYLPEARDKAERILAMPGGPPEDRLKALDAAGGIAYWQGDVLPSRAWYQQEATLATELGDEPGLAEALYNESFTYSLDPSISDQQRSRELAQDALDRFRSLGDRQGEGKALWGVVNSYVFSDDRGPAAALVEESIAIARELDDRFQLGWALFTRGLIAMQVADHDLARASYEEAIKIFHETDDLTGYVIVLDGFAALEWVTGDRDVAMRIAGAASAIQDVAGIGLAQINREAAQFFPDEMLRESEFASEHAAGKALTADQAIELALHRAGSAKG
jgi:predicted ATPase/class 3 adenylate cyclase